MRTDELDFHLPPDLIAQTPLPDRAACRLLHYRRSDKSIHHSVFSDLPSLLKSGDLLVFNNARVVPARFVLLKPTGGRVEGLFLDEPAPGQWHVLLRDVGNLPEGATLHFAQAPDIAATLLQRLGDGEHLLALSSATPAFQFLEQIGRMPLPPYIKRQKNYDDRDALDRQQYQTVYAAAPGSVAAPTAGLHFTDDLLRRLDQLGIHRTFITLHVGMGTFKPVTADTLDQHIMHSEAYTIDPSAANALNSAKQENRRIVAVGTTSARVLESQPDTFSPVQSATSIFIHPPYRWRHVGALITNFHLPRSTLIALVAALTGLDEQRRLYNEAIAQRYRFFSYGDASFIE